MMYKYEKIGDFKYFKMYIWEKNPLLIICLLYMYWHFGLALYVFYCFFKQHLNTCIDADIYFLLMFTLKQECFKFQYEIQTPLIDLNGNTFVGFNGVRMLQLRFLIQIIIFIGIIFAFLLL